MLAEHGGLEIIHQAAAECGGILQPPQEEGAEILPFQGTRYDLRVGPAGLDLKRGGAEEYGEGEVEMEILEEFPPAPSRRRPVPEEIRDVGPETERQL